MASTPVALTVVEPGRIFIGEEEIALGDLAASLKARGISPRKRILLHTDGRASYGAVMRIMGSLSSAGFAKVGVIDTKSRPSD